MKIVRECLDQTMRSYFTVAPIPKFTSYEKAVDIYYKELVNAVSNPDVCSVRLCRDNGEILENHIV